MKALVFLIRYPLAGAMFAVGALAALHYLGPREIRPLGRAGGEGFAQGIATINAAREALHV